MSLRFYTETRYASTLEDLDFWRPHIVDILLRHGIAPTELKLYPGNHTNVVVFIGQQYVLKIYTPFYNGRDSKGIEVAALRIYNQSRVLPVPRIVATGELMPSSGDWSWPYAITDFVPGTPLAKRWKRLGKKSKIETAKEIGRLLKTIHQTPPHKELQDCWLRHWPKGFVQFLEKRHVLLMERKDFADLPYQEELIGLNPAKTVGRLWPSLLHGDLETEHILQENGKTIAILDWGDVKLGDPIYDFVGLHLGDFNRDKELTRAALQAYGASFEEGDFIQKAMLYTILHEWELSDLENWRIEADALTLSKVAEWLWGGVVP